MAPPQERNKLPSGLCIIVLVWSNLEGDYLYLQCWTSQAQKHRGEEKEHSGVGASGQSAVAKAEERTVGKRSSVCSGTGLHLQWIMPLKHLFIYTLHHFRVNNEHFTRIQQSSLEQPPHWSLSCQSHHPSNLPSPVTDRELSETDLTLFQWKLFSGSDYLRGYLA